MPLQSSLLAAICRAVPTRLVICTSCPQACMVKTSFPVIGSICVLREAFSRPDFSSTGKPSMSARIMTSGPSPFSIIATTPVPPTSSVTSKPAARNSVAMRAAVSCSISDSSGLR